ncbi:head decoration protein [Cereibacter johrii]|uniref:head decoration protein n=1 Tax=Cereibacter johrii TaxID=445629 RepID=UPI003CF364B0
MDPGPFPSATDTESVQGPRLGPFFFLFQGALAGSSVLRRLPAFDPAAIARSLTPLLDRSDMASAARAVSAIVRDAEVNGNLLTYHTSRDEASEKAAARLDLAAAGIIVR